MADLACREVYTMTRIDATLRLRRTSSRARCQQKLRGGARTLVQSSESPPSFCYDRYAALRDISPVLRGEMLESQSLPSPHDKAAGRRQPQAQQERYRRKRSEC